MTLWGSASLLRARDGEEAKVSYVELFFDLVYVFAVTQLSHRLLGDLSVLGAVQSLVLWFAVWLCWQYTCWVTNWFDPQAIPFRLLLFAIALLALVMSSSIPAAFAGRGLVFAFCYVLMQVGRTCFVLLHLGPRHGLSANFRRMLAWLCISGVLWIVGGLAEGPVRLWLWILAVGCEYISPMSGFRLPFLGRSRTSDWTIEGGHLAERCQLFVIIALGESLVATGASLGQSELWSAPILIAFAVTFLGTVAMWWMYFDTSSKAGSEAIVNSPDPGRMGAYFHYVHVTIVAGVIVMAVADDLVITHAHAHADAAELAVLLAGPGIFMLGNGIYQAIVYGRFPLSHVVGLLALSIVAALALVTDLLMLGGAVSLILLLVAAWNGWSRRSAAVA